MGLWLRASLLLLLAVAAAPLPAAEFWQSNWVKPERTQSEALLVRPLAAEDSEALYQSYMGSQEWLYQRLGWGWPSDKTTKEQNHSMMQVHLAQQDNNKAFTYVVIDRQRDRIIGAVYFVPVIAARSQSGAIDTSKYNAEVSWWLTERAVSNSLHNDLFQLMTDWLKTGWPWGQVLFPVAESNQPARAVLESSSARLAGHNEDAEELFYSYTLARK